MTEQELKLIEEIHKSVQATIKAKEEQYKGSWIKRGGIGAFMMLARKWDRIENAAEYQGYNIMAALRCSRGPDGLDDDIKDLIAYLSMCLAHHHVHVNKPATGKT